MAKAKKSQTVDAAAEAAEPTMPLKIEVSIDFEGGGHPPGTRFSGAFGANIDCENMHALSVLLQAMQRRATPPKPGPAAGARDLHGVFFGPKRNGAQR